MKNGYNDLDRSTSNDCESSTVSPIRVVGSVGRRSSGVVLNLFRGV